MLKQFFSLVIVAAFLMGIGTLSARCEVRPGWTHGNEKSLNSKRTNDSYEFKVFRYENIDQVKLHSDRFVPLFEYLAGQYGADALAMSVDSLATFGETTYRISFNAADGPATVLAQLVDSYEDIDYNVVSDPIFECYQLYAIGRKNADVNFDEFKDREINKALAGVISVIPGVGQLYKGNTGKGIAMLGSGLAIAGCGVASQLVGNKWRSMIDNAEPAYKDSWKRKGEAMNKQRNVLIGAFGLLSVYSIVDAVVSDAVPQIVVNEAEGSTISLAPSTQGAGIALVLAF